MNFDKRYLIVSGAVLVQSVVIGCVFAYGVFFTLLESEFGWSRTLLSSATAVSFLGMGVIAIVAGRLTDQYGPRGVLVFAAVCTGAAYLLLYFLSSPWQLFLIYGLLVSVGLGVHDVVTLSTVARWFPGRRGMMSGIVKVGAACGQMTIPILAVALITAVGWRSSFAVLGAGALVLLLLAAWLVGIKPDAGAVAGTRSTKLQNTASAVTAMPGLTFPQARKARQFWTLCTMQFFSFSCLTTIPTHIVPHGIDSGMTTATAATLLSLIAASSIAGRLLVGHSSDKIGGKSAFIVCLAGLGLSLIALVFIVQPAYLFGFAIVYGFSHGGLFTVVSPTVAEYFGMRAHGVIFGAIVFSGTLGGAVMPVITGMIFDRSGSYMLAFTLMATMAAVSLLLATTLKLPSGIASVNAVRPANTPV